MASEPTRRTIRRPLPTPDVLGYDEPLPERLFLMAEDALAGRHADEVRREIEIGLAVLGPYMKKGRPDRS